MPQSEYVRIFSWKTEMTFKFWLHHAGNEGNPIQPDGVSPLVSTSGRLPLSTSVLNRNLRLEVFESKIVYRLKALESRDRESERIVSGALHFAKMPQAVGVAKFGQ